MALLHESQLSIKIPFPLLLFHPYGILRCGIRLYHYPKICMKFFMPVNATGIKNYAPSAISITPNGVIS
jgi:hypothetical protein